LGKGRKIFSFQVAGKYPSFQEVGRSKDSCSCGMAGAYTDTKYSLETTDQGAGNTQPTDIRSI
jgi:hypothetical protein